MFLFHQRASLREHGATLTNTRSVQPSDEIIDGLLLLPNTIKQSDRLLAKHLMKQGMYLNKAPHEDGRHSHLVETQKRLKLYS